MEHIWFTKTIHFDPELGYVMLKLPEISLPEFSHDGIEFEPKTELHCSLLSTKVLAKEYFTRSPFEVSEELKLFIQSFLKSHQVAFDGLINKTYICESNEAKSIIVEARLHGIRDLFASLRTAFSELAILPDPLLHVTLYKYNHRYGIGIHNEAQLQELCRPLPFNELPSVVKEMI